MIVGAGIGGLTAAVGLLARGIEVDIFEQSHELREVGAGLQISPNGTRALVGLGLGNALRERSSFTQGKEIRLWNNGQTWKLFDLGASAVSRYGASYYTIYRPDLLDALAQAVRAIKPDAIHLGRRLVSFLDDGRSVKLAFADGGIETGAALIGADGIHSRVRGQMFGDPPASFTGMICWRAVIPTAMLPTRLVRPVGTNWVGPGGHVIHYPLRNGTLMNFAAVVESQSWKSDGWTTRGEPAELRRHLQGWHDDVQSMIAAIEEPYKWALIARTPLRQWTQGRATLLGDACHATLPFLAQGAVQAIEDGFILARAIAESDDIESALLRYQGARVARTVRMVEESIENGKRFHSPCLARSGEAERYVEKEWASARVGDRYDWLFDYDVVSAPI